MQQLNGFVKIHRKLIQWGWYQDHAVKEVWLHLLLTASYKDAIWQGREIKAGQVIVGTQQMAKDLDFSRQQIRTALKKLNSTNEITIKSTNKYSIVTLVNWEEYQIQCESVTNEITNTITNNQPTNNQQITNNQPTNNHIVRIKEYKNTRKQEDIYKKKYIKKNAEEFANEYTDNTELKNAIIAFVEMRKEIKSPMTENAIKLMLSKLKKMSDDDNVQIEILNQSIMNNWKGIFALKEQKQNVSSAGNPFANMISGGNL